MLKTLIEKQKSNWKEALKKLVFTYNFPPFYLLFSHSPRLPVDTLFGLTQDQSATNHRGYVEHWKKAERNK